MVDSLSRSGLLEKFEDKDEMIARGKELRDKGYKIHHHPIWQDSVEIPSGEQLDETQIKVRYGDGSIDNKVFEEAFEYLILCKEKLCKIRGLKFLLS